MNSTEGNVNNIANAIDQAFQTAIVQPVVAEAPATPSVEGLKWATPDAYRAETGKRFRVTNEEKALHGDTPEGRMAAFIARQTAGLLG